MKNSILVTGATGFVGSNFVYQFAAKYADLFCLIRDGKEDPSDRIAKTMRLVSESYLNEYTPLKNLHPVLGNLEEIYCGVCDKNIELLANKCIPEVWHFASTVKYEDEKQEEICSINIEGTKNLIELSRRIGAHRFIYISTAYSCGTQIGDIEEKITLPSDFNNEYERSKNAAEHCIKDLCDLYGMEWIIIRPSIVVGPSISRKTGGSTTGLYGFIRELYRAKKILSATDSMVRIKGDPEAILNVIPADHLMDEIDRIIQDGLANRSVHHITSSCNLTIKDCLDSIKDSLGIKNIEFDNNMSAPWSRAEEVINKKVDFYKSYLFKGKRFLRSSRRTIGVDNNAVIGFIDECVKELDQKRAQAKSA